MIIVLENGNFVNNIGSIELPISMQQETISVLSSMTKYNVNSAEATALNNLIYALKQAGVWGKISYFCPFGFANTPSQLLFNPISGKTLSMTEKNSNFTNTDGISTTGTTYNAMLKIDNPHTIGSNFYIFSESSTNVLMDEVSTDISKISLFLNNGCLGLYDYMNFNGTPSAVFGTNNSAQKTRVNVANIFTNLDFTSGAISDGIFGKTWNGNKIVAGFYYTGISAYQKIYPNNALSYIAPLNYDSLKIPKHSLCIIGNGGALSDVEAEATVDAVNAFVVAMGSTVNV